MGVIGLEEGFMFQAESKEHVAWLQSLRQPAVRAT